MQTLIGNNLSLHDVPQKDYGNYSAIAKLWKPKVKDIVGQNIKLESLITAVERAKVGYKSM